MVETRSMRMTKIVADKPSTVQASLRYNKRKLNTTDEAETQVKLKKNVFNTKLHREIKKQKKRICKVDTELQKINFGLRKLLEVYKDHSCILNQTNIGTNKNKFYINQICNAGKFYLHFTRWGRVGEIGQTNTTRYLNPKNAIAAFEKKFKNKTLNNWEDRDDFQPYAGKYTLLEMVYQSDDESEDDDSQLSLSKDKTKISKVRCLLDKRTQLLIKLIFHDDMFLDQMSLLNLDVKQMPLGKLSKSQIAKSLEALLDIEKAIKENKTAKELAYLTSILYALMPHNFKRKVSPTITATSDIDKKMELLMTLSDIELAQSMQKERKEDPLEAVHQLDEMYVKLNCDLEHLNQDSDEYKMIEKYRKVCLGSRKGIILDMWKVNRRTEGERFIQHKDISHRKLLWHGTNVTAVAAILKSGLRIMPTSGGRVGKGIYFSSEYSKSAWLVQTHIGVFKNEARVGFMILSEVALGKIKEIQTEDRSLEAAPTGYDSVVARGYTEPDSKHDIVMNIEGNEVIVPIGKPKPQEEFQSSQFIQSEYLVYKESQVRIRYLIKLSL